MLLSSNSIALLIGCLASLWAARLFWQYKRLLRSVGHTPGVRTFFSPIKLYSRLLPEIPGINRKPSWLWKVKYGGMCHTRYMTHT